MGIPRPGDQSVERARRSGYLCRTSVGTLIAALLGLTMTWGCRQESEHSQARPATQLKDASAADQPLKTAFHEELVSFRSGGNTLNGLLVLPDSPGPHVAIAFVHGSGSQDRDGWTVHPPIREHLARHGIASICWDKPGTGKSSGDWTRQSFQDRAQEALDAVAFLRGRADIDTKHVGLWGISQGGWICPLAASQSAQIAFIIVVSAPAVTIAEQDLYRVEHEMRADGMPEGDIKSALAFAGGQIEILRDAPYKKLDAAQQDVANEPWFRDYVHRLGAKDFAFGKKNLAYDGRPVLERVTCPVLAIYGEHDTIVPVDKSAIVFREALAKAGNADVTVQLFSGADHFMFLTKTGGPRERLRDKDRPKAFAPGYLATMTSWISKRVTPAP